MEVIFIQIFIINVNNKKINNYYKQQYIFLVVGVIIIKKHVSGVKNRNYHNYFYYN